MATYKIDSKKFVTKDEFDAKLVATLQKVSRVRVVTPPEDVQIVANLLGVSTETLGEPGLGFPKGKETCGQCGRAFTFLDIVETGLLVHSKEFLVDVITGKLGYFVNSEAQSFNCHNCGTKCGPGDYEVGNYYQCDFPGQ